MSEVIHRPNNDGLTPISYSNSKPNVRSLQVEVDELRNKDDEFAAQLAETAKEKEVLETKLTLMDTTPVQSRNHLNFQAIIEPPIPDMTFENAAIAIHASFQKGECLSEKHLRVFDENNNEIAFQIECTKDAKTGAELGKYPDNSLKFVTIWILQTISNKKILTVKVYDQEQQNTFEEKVRHVAVNSSREEYQIGNDAISFEAPLWQARRLIANGTDLNSNVELTKGAIFDNNLADVNPVSSTQATFIEKATTGDGVVFREHTTKFKFVYNDGIEVTQRVRYFANKKIDIETFYRITKDLPAGVFGGFSAKINWTPLASAANLQNDPDGYVGQETDDVQFLVGTHDMQSFSKNFTGGYATSAAISGSSARHYFGIKAPSAGGIVAMPNGTFFSVRQFISYNYGRGNSVNEILRRKNGIVTRLTKFNLQELKRRFINLSKRHIENMYFWNKANANGFFSGLEGLESLASEKLLGYQNKLDEAISRLNKGLTTFYGNGTKSGFYNAWMNNKGLEFIGRDMSALEYLLHTKEHDRIVTIIHNLADAMIDIEVKSGGNGKVYLRWNANQDMDNLNAEAAAIKFLALSLSLSENQARRDCMNRIINRFLGSIEFKNRAPYNKPVSDSARKNTIVQPTMHYHAFCFYDFFDAVHRLKLSELTLPSIRQYVMEGTNAAGQVLEVGYQYNPTRRGSASTNLYIAGLLIRYGDNISDFEHACQLLEHVLSKSLPTGHHEHPIDGWDADIGAREATSAIESQILIESVYALLKE